MERLQLLPQLFYVRRRHGDSFGEPIFRRPAPYSSRAMKSVRVSPNVYFPAKSLFR